MEVLVGTNDTDAGGERYRAEEIILHEDFESRHLANNIGLVRLNKPIEFNDRVQPIKYTADAVPENTELVVTGFGVTWVS